MGSKNFAKEIGVGFALDLVFTLTMFFLQALNNSTLNSLSLEKVPASGHF